MSSRYQAKSSAPRLWWVWTTLSAPSASVAAASILLITLASLTTGGGAGDVVNLGTGTKRTDHVGDQRLDPLRHFAPEVHIEQSDGSLQLDVRRDDIGGGPSVNYAKDDENGFPRVDCVADELG